MQGGGGRGNARRRREGRHKEEEEGGRRKKEEGGKKTSDICKYAAQHCINVVDTSYLVVMTPMKLKVCGYC